MTKTSLALKLEMKMFVTLALSMNFMTIIKTMILPAINCQIGLVENSYMCGKFTLESHLGIFALERILHEHS